jgi:hypothetical protein
MPYLLFVALARLIYTWTPAYAYFAILLTCLSCCCCCCCCICCLCASGAAAANTGGQYSGGFVSEFNIFVAELREFFNAAGLTDLLHGVKGAMSNEDQQVRMCWKCVASFKVQNACTQSKDYHQRL